MKIYDVEFNETINIKIKDIACMSPFDFHISLISGEMIFTNEKDYFRVLKKYMGCENE